MDVTNLSPAQLRKAADLKERIDSLSSELSSILGGAVSLNPQPLPPKVGRGGRRQMSAAGRARIAAAARVRWAKVRGDKGGSSESQGSAAASGKPRRQMSAAGRARIAAAAKARWAKAKAAGKSRL
jgi:hypothetical protein